MTIGCRIYGAELHLLRSGQYAKWDRDGNWYAVPPGTDLLAGLAKHRVVEHDDGTITVSPSIEVSSNDPTRAANYWHGFLERGIWRED